MPGEVYDLPGTSTFQEGGLRRGVAGDQSGMAVERRNLGSLFFGSGKARHVDPETPIDVGIGDHQRSERLLQWRGGMRRSADEGGAATGNAQQVLLDQVPTALPVPERRERHRLQSAIGKEDERPLRAYEREQGADELIVQSGRRSANDFYWSARLYRRPAR